MNVISAKKRVIFLFGTGVFVFIVLCSGFLFTPRPIPNPPVGFEQTNCNNPCWYGLQVGVSTRQDIHGVLKTFPSDSKKIQINEGKYNSGSQYIEIMFLDVSYRYNHNGPTPKVTFLFDIDSDDATDHIYISDMLVMKQALDIFGEPDSVIVYSYEFLPDFWKKDLHLYYQNRGVSISCFEGTTFSTSDHPPCFDDSEVSLGYFDPEDFRQELEAQFGDADLALQYMQPYQGIDAKYQIFKQK